MKNIITITILFFIAVACADSTNEVVVPEIVIDAPNDEMEIEEILSGSSAKTWLSQSFELEMFGSLNCRADDVFTFFADGTYEYDGGATLCGDSDNQQIVRGTWEVDLENKQIIFNKDTDVQAIANYITVKEDLIRVMGSWNNLSIDAQFARQ